VPVVVYEFSIFKTSLSRDRGGWSELDVNRALGPPLVKGWSEKDIYI
jgi:hypothetical protein